jgi:hypothetical protein
MESLKLKLSSGVYKMEKAFAGAIYEGSSRCKASSSFL